MSDNPLKEMEERLTGWGLYIAEEAEALKAGLDMFLQLRAEQRAMDRVAAPLIEGGAAPRKLRRVRRRIRGGV